MGEITVGYRIPPGAVAGIYHAYPKHVKPARAKKAIALALRRIANRLLERDTSPHEWMLQRVEHYARCRRDADSRFTPHCATWMNDDRYDDDSREWGRDSTRPQPSQAEQEFQAMQNCWQDVPLDDRYRIADVVVAGCSPYGLTARQLRQALSIWDKHKGTSSE